MKKYQAIITHQISETDKGIYDAQNKGLRLATAEYVLFLNSGDWLVDAFALEKFLSSIITPADVLYGNLLVQPIVGEPWVKEYPDQLTLDYFYRDGLPHPATLIRASLLRRFGGYDEHFAICSDWKFFLQVFLEARASFCHIPEVLSCFHENGISSKPENRPIIQQERTDIWRQLVFPPAGFLKRTLLKVKSIWGD